MATDFIEGSATFTNGSNVVTAVTLTQNTLSGVAEGVIVKVSSDPVIDNVEAVKALAVDSFQLRNVWPHATGTYTFMMNYLPDAVKGATRVMQSATDALNNATANSLSEADADLRYLQLTDAESEYVRKEDHNAINMVIDGRLDNWYEGETSSTQGYSSSTTLYSVYDGTVSSTREDLSGTSQVVIDVPTAQYCKKTTVTSNGSYTIERTVIPNVRNYAGQDITVSVYLEVDVARNVAIELCQNFGTTGSARVTGIGSQLVAVTDTFARYDVQVSVPNVNGKTIDTDSYLEINVWLSQDGTYNTRAASLANQTGDTSIACIQTNKGDVAYEFEELTPVENYKRTSSVYWETDYSRPAASISRSAFTASGVIVNDFPSKMISTPVVTNGVISNGTLSGNSITVTSNYTIILPSSSASTAFEGAGKKFDSRLGDTIV